MKKIVILPKILEFNSKLLKLIRVYITRKCLELYQQGDNVIPQNVKNILYKIWVFSKPVLKPTIIFMLSIAKRVSSKPIMRAMSTVDHKRIRVMYLMFRLCARIMSV